MLKKINVEYDKNKCIGQGNCAKVSPQTFILKGGKAILQNCHNISGDVFSLDLEIDETASQRVINAAKSCPVNAIKVVDLQNHHELVGTKIKEEEMKEVFAEYDDEKEFVLDEAGYFLMRVDREKQNMEVAFCNERNKIVLKVVGKKPIDIYQVILNKKKLNIRKDHAAYLGRELEKAFIALKYNLKYVQDDELDLKELI